MDDLLREFLTETGESLDVVDVELVRFEQEPNNVRILDNIFRLVHTIKGTCGFLALPRLEALAHAAETLMGRFRDGVTVTPAALDLVLSTLDRIKAMLAELEASGGTEAEGDDSALIRQLEAMAGSAAESRRASGVLSPGDVPYELARAFRDATVEAPRPVASGRVPAVDFARVAAEIEAQLAASRPPWENRPAEPHEADKTPVASQSIRVTVDALEQLMTLVSELVLTRNQLLEIARRHEESPFKIPLQRLATVTAELQESVMKTRMQPIGNAWQKLPRVVRDLAHELGKEIELELAGAETELDRQVLELVKDPLTHMVRNSADHGLETPAERLRTGKSARGTIRLSAFHEGGHIIVRIADDGRGLDLARIRRKALDLGLADEAALDKMSDVQLSRFIFAPGFSTAAALTSVSGRGVGMDVVRTNIEQIGGSIDVKSTRGAGSTFTIKIPLTLAIVPTLIVAGAGGRYAVPQTAVMELVRARAASAHQIERISGAPVLRLRGRLLPVISLQRLLGGAAPEREEGFIVVMQVGEQTFGLNVDAVFHTEEIVVKPMSKMLRSVALFSGNTILGDGSVIMILDPNAVAAAVGASAAAGTLPAGPAAPGEEDDRQPVAMLLFRAGSPDPKAVPLALITRLEEVPVERIEHANRRELVQYRGSLMPLIRIAPDAERRLSGSQPILVFSDAGRSMGLVVDEVLDIVEEPLAIEVPSDEPGILGSAVLKGRATDIVDVGYFLPLAFPDWFARRERQPDPAQPALLLVDDSAFFRNMLGPVLKAAGFAVTLAASAAEALRLVEAGRAFDVVVSDIEMPGASGFDLCQSLRRDRRHASVPFIALSAHSSPAAIERGRAVGVDDYVSKFDRPGLLAALTEFGRLAMGIAA